MQHAPRLCRDFALSVLLQHHLVFSSRDLSGRLRRVRVGDVLNAAWQVAGLRGSVISAR